MKDKLGNGRTIIRFKKKKKRKPSTLFLYTMLHGGKTGHFSTQKNKVLENNNINIPKTRLSMLTNAFNYSTWAEAGESL